MVLTEIAWHNCSLDQLMLQGAKPSQKGADIQPSTQPKAQLRCFKLREDLVTQFLHGRLKSREFCGVCFSVGLRLVHFQFQALRK